MTRHSVARTVPRQIRREVPASTSTRIHVHTRGGVDPRDVGYARYKVNAALEHARDPVLLARARLTQHHNPALDRPALAQANLDLGGVLVRAQVAAPTMHEAIDELHDRLLARIDRASHDWQAIRGARPVPGEWRHDSPARPPLPYFPRAAEDRQVVRHKAFAVATETVEEAAFDMDLLDYEFHLFVEEGSGQDSVLHRTPDGLRLAQVSPRPDAVSRGEVPFAVSERPAASLDVDGAIAHLEHLGTPFVFFRDARTGRGNVLYHRYDGHYGLIVPVE